MAAAISNHPTATSDSLAILRASPMSSSSVATASSTSSDKSSSTISANDFLTLLVTEMRNQDPTATTDPNEYINQLVNVNSLEQLIDINQTLTSAYGSSSSSSASSNAAKAAVVGPQCATVSATLLASSRLLSQATASSASGSEAQSPTPGIAQGNLSVPQNSLTAERLAQFLAGNAPSFTGSDTIR